MGFRALFNLNRWKFIVTADDLNFFFKGNVPGLVETAYTVNAAYVGSVENYRYSAELRRWD